MLRIIEVPKYIIVFNVEMLEQIDCIPAASGLCRSHPASSPERMWLIMF